MSADNGPGKKWIGWLGILIGPAFFLLAAFLYWGPNLSVLPEFTAIPIDTSSGSAPNANGPVTNHFRLNSQGSSGPGTSPRPGILCNPYGLARYCLRGSDGRNHLASRFL